MEKIKNLKLSTKIIISIIVLLSIVSIYCFVRYLIDKNSVEKANELYNTVVVEENSWNLFYLQNRFSTGEYAGYIYEHDYTIDTLPSEYIISLIVDNYIATHEDFYESKNYSSSTDTYHVTVSNSELTSFIHSLFGPDYNLPIIETSYGCGRRITKSGENYLIESKLPDSCGLLSREDTGYYVTYIDSYKQQNKNEITINLKVAYIEEIVEETYGTDDYVKTTYNAYSSKDKKKLLKLNIDSKCINAENVDKSCYSYYENYLVTLKKAKDNKYYFYSIAKDK